MDTPKSANERPTISERQLLLSRGNTAIAALEQLLQHLQKQIDSISPILEQMRRLDKEYALIPEGGTPTSEVLKTVRTMRPELANLTDAQIVAMANGTKGAA